MLGAIFIVPVLELLPRSRLALVSHALEFDRLA